MIASTSGGNRAPNLFSNLCRCQALHLRASQHLVLVPSGGNCRPGIPQIRHFLKKANLAQYAEAFIEQGYDDIEYLAHGPLDMPQLQSDVGMKPGHVQRFVMYLRPDLEVRRLT